MHRAPQLRDCPDCPNWWGKASPKCGQCLLVATYVKRHGGGASHSFLAWPSLLFIELIILFLWLLNLSFQISITSTLQVWWHHMRTAEAPSLMDWETTELLSSSLEQSYCGTTTSVVPRLKASVTARSPTSQMWDSFAYCFIVNWLNKSICGWYGVIYVYKFIYACMYIYHVNYIM